MYMERGRKRGGEKLVKLFRGADVGGMCGGWVQACDVAFEGHGSRFRLRGEDGTQAQTDVSCRPDPLGGLRCVQRLGSWETFVGLSEEADLPFDSPGFTSPHPRSVSLR